MTAAARIPSGPKGHPLVGNLPEFSRDPLGFLLMCARDYGDIVSLRVAGMKAYIINHPDLIEEVLVTNNRSFIKDRTARLRPFHLLLGNGLLTSEGDFWLRQRRLAQPAFHRERIAAYADVMVAYTERMLDGWQDGQTRDAHEEMARLTLAIVAKTLFNSDVETEAERVGHALEIVNDRFASQGSLVRALDNYLPTPGWIRFKKAVRRLDEIIYRIISEHRRASDSGDLLSMLLRAQDEDGSRMTDRQLRDEAMTLFLAGHETTALALSWTWYLLAQNPDAEAKLHAELDCLLDSRAPVFQDLPQLCYTERVIKEAMRLYPPAWSFGRQAVIDTSIGGYDVPAGTQIYMAQWTMHRDLRYFAEPEKFNPDRWTEEFEKRLPRYAYFPFGGGPRLCIGNQFAMMEAVLILATIARRFKLALVKDQPVTPWPSVTLRPKDGIKALLIKRQIKPALAHC